MLEKNRIAVVWYDIGGDLKTVSGPELSMPHRVAGSTGNRKSKSSRTGVVGALTTSV